MVPIVKPCPHKGQTVAEKRIPYFRFYPSDFMRGVRGMTAQEVGLYTMLLCRMYEESGPIEDHALRLSTYCGMRQATFEKTLQKLVDLGKIIRQDGTLWNDRAEIEISSRANDLKIAIKAGKASAEKRQQKQRQGATPVQRPFNHTDTDTDTRDTNVSLSIVAPPSKPPDLFSEFWDRYPKRVGKGDAHKAYIKALKKITHDDLMFALSERLPALEAKEKQFRPNPATWLNQERWTDDIDASNDTGRPRSGGSGNAMVDAFAAVAAERTARDRRG